MVRKIIVMKILLFVVLLIISNDIYAQHKYGFNSDTVTVSYISGQNFKITFDKSVNIKSISSKIINFDYRTLKVQADTIKHFLESENFFTDDDTILLEDQHLDSIKNLIEKAYQDLWNKEITTSSNEDSCSVNILKNNEWTYRFIILNDDNKAISIKICKDSTNKDTCTAFNKDLTLNTSIETFQVVYQNLIQREITADRINYNDSLRLEYYIDTIYKVIKNCPKKNIEESKRLVRNWDSLVYNDSLQAHLIFQREIPYYKYVVKDSIFEKAGSLSLTSGRVYINEGYIYNISISINNESVESLKILPSQTFSRKISLRNIMFAQYMISRDLGVVSLPHRFLSSDRINFNNENDKKFKKSARLWNIFILQNDYRKIQNDSTTPRYVMFPEDIINFSPPSKSPNPIFTAQEQVLTFYKDSLGKPVTVKERSLYSFLNLDVFTDLIGLFSEEKPNGLLQTELKAFFRGFRQSVSQTFTSRVRATFFNRGEFFFRLSKLDDKNRYLNVLHTNDANGSVINRYVHGFNLLQYQSIYSGIRANILEVAHRGGSISLFTEASFLRTPLLDTLVSEQGGSIVRTPTTFGINSRLVSPGINMKFNVASFLDVEVMARLIWFKPQGSKNIKMSKDEYSDFYTNSFIESKRTWLPNYRGIVTVNLDDEKTKRLILRVERFNENKQQGNNFWVAQVGYSADLNKFITFKDSKKN